MANALIKLFGRPALVVDGETRPVPEKAFALLAMLVAAKGEPIGRSQIRALLWSDSDRTKATANLRQLIARLLRVAGKSDLRLLETVGEGLRLNRTTCRSDYGDFLDALSMGAAPLNCSMLLDLWGGPLLAELSFDEAPLDEWLEATRERLRQRYVDAARRALDDASDAAADAAWRLALRVIEIDPTEEAAYRAMMRICAARGERGLGLRIFGRCKRTLASELGVLPGLLTEELARALRLSGPGAGGVSLTMPAGARRRGPPGKPEPLRQIPAVMVVPPRDLPTDRETRGLALGLVEDVTLGLTRFRHFSVVAPHHGAAFSRRMPVEALRAMDVDYAVTATLIPGNAGPRLAFRLNDVASAEVLWATDVDLAAARLAGAFEQAVGLVVRSLIETIEACLMRTPVPANDASAYQHYLEGRRLLSGTDLPAIRRARQAFRRALDEVADYPAAVAGIARTLVEERLVRVLTEDDLLRESVALATRAAALDPSDSRAFQQLGNSNLYLRRHGESLAAFAEALRLNPHDADIMADYADALSHSGEPGRALELCRKAIGLNQNPPESYAWILGSIHFQLGEYRSALEALQPVEGRAAISLLLAAVAGQLGDQELTRRYSRVVRRVYPDMNVDETGARTPNLNKVDTEHLIDGMKRAGLA